MPEAAVCSLSRQQSAAPAAPRSGVMSPLTGAALPSCRGGDRHNPAIGAGDTLYTALPTLVIAVHFRTERGEYLLTSV